MTIQGRTAKLGFLIRCLEEEMPQYAHYGVPDTPRDAFLLYRALCNVRLPYGETGHTLPVDFYVTEDEVLQDITREKGITNAATLPGSALDMRLSLWQGDITTLKIDAIVNAANSQMLGCFVPLHNCIDNNIHTMAGTRLREECYRIMKQQGHEEPVGRAKVTKGYNLPATYVIHTVGPCVEGTVTERDRAELSSCYTSVLAAADRKGICSLAFCCISTGVFHFPQEEAAHIAVRTVLGWLADHPETSVRQVVFNVFKDSDRKLYETILQGGYQP